MCVCVIVRPPELLHLATCLFICHVVFSVYFRILRRSWWEEMPSSKIYGGGQLTYEMGNLGKFILIVITMYDSFIHIYVQFMLFY